MAILDDKLGPSLSMLSSWIETMQILPGAYGGPVVHWWLCSFIYCGSGVNWTYEGLLEGFIELHKKTKDDVWLKRAIEAANYIREAQMPDGTYKNSFFESNPAYGSSSVHEASVDLGMISLASHLEEIGEDGGKFIDSVVRNAEMSLFQRLWNPSLGTFRSTGNSMIKSSYVFNAMATVAQVFLRLYSIKGETKYRELVSSTLSFILRYQRKTPNDPVLGSFPQGLHDSTAYTLYNARILTFLNEAYKTFGEQSTLVAAQHCGDFLRRLEHNEGGFSFFADAKGRICNRPNLIGGVAEAVRALRELQHLSSQLSSFDENPHIEWLLRFQDPVGGFRTGFGFHYDAAKNDFKDLFHVCGWNDKVFRLLSSVFQGGTLRSNAVATMKEPCWIGNTRTYFIEDEHEISIQDDKEKKLYMWKKGENLSYVDNHYLKYFARICPAQSISGYDVRATLAT